MLPPFQTPVGTMKGNSAALTGKNIGKNLYYMARLGTICSRRSALLVPYRTQQRTLCGGQLDVPLNSSRCQNRSSFSADTNRLLNSSAQRLVEGKEERSREVPAKDQQRCSNCAEILSAVTPSHHSQLTVTPRYVPFYHDRGSGWK